MDLTLQTMSDIIVFSKYARHLPKLKRRETWEEIVNRNMAMHIKKYPHIEEEIVRVYKLVFNKKVLPSSRSLQFAGKPIEVSPNRLYNCSALPVDNWFAFAEIMFLLLGGSGVGYSVQFHHVDKLPPLIKPTIRKRRHLVADSIEGWAESIKVLMKAYFFGLSDPVFDFSDIRPKGSPLVTSGGKAPGAKPLKDCIHNMKGILDAKNSGDKLTSVECHDLICFISEAVLSGGIRRAACAALFSLDDMDMLTCKTGRWQEDNPQRSKANNSAVILRHRIKKKEFKELWKRMQLSKTGEPGIFFSNNMEWTPNPCFEISLRPLQFCNLTTLNASDVGSVEDLEERVRAAAFIGTLQAGYTDFHFLRDEWKKTTEKEALLGISMTGIASSKIFKYNLKEVAEVAIEENKRVAELIGINPAARLTCVKPEGSSSLVLGTSSGIHPWYNDYYIRRIRLNKEESIYKYLVKVIPDLVEDSFDKPHIDAFLKIPVKAPRGAALRHEPAIELLGRVKWFFENWIQPGHISGDNTNNVSATVFIKDDEWDEVSDWMWSNRNFYNGLSTFPASEDEYVQPPLEDCSKYIYDKMYESLREIDLTRVEEEDDNTDLKGEVVCGGGSCEVA